MSVRRVVALSLAAMSLGCDSGDSGTAPEPGPALRVIARPQARDTVQATSAQALVVEFRTPAGRLEAGKVVRFEVGPPSDPLRKFERGVVVCRLDGPPCNADFFTDGPFASDTTDAQGRAKAIVRFGRVSGPAWIVVQVPEYGVKDSVRFDVDPGSPARIRVTNRDSVVMFGRQLTLVATVVDRFGNARADPLAYRAADAIISVDAMGKVTPAASGRTHVLITSGSAQDTAFLSVVPTGRLMAVVVQGNADNVVAMDFDGSNRRVIARNASLPRVAVDGRVIVHAGTDLSTYRMHLVEADGSLKRITSATTPLEGEAYGHLAADGWVYFSGRFPSGNFAIWRVRPDGSGQERITNGYAEWISWPSPDGRKIVYTSYTNRWEITIMDVATRQTTSLNAEGLFAAWSPNGQFIAFTPDNGSALWTARGDGTNVQKVPNTEFIFGGTVDWTADNQYLIVRTVRAIELIRVADGERLPLSFSQGMNFPVRAP